MVNHLGESLGGAPRGGLGRPRAKPHAPWGVPWGPGTHGWKSKLGYVNWNILSLTQQHRWVFLGHLGRVFIYMYQFGEEYLVQTYNPNGTLPKK